jgi:hypothetical protein
MKMNAEKQYKITIIAIFAIAVLLVLLLFVLIHAVIEEEKEEEKEWQAFSVAHNCKVAAMEKGHLSTGVGYGMTANGKFGTVITATQTPDKTAWLCDDGVTYWR